MALWSNTDANTSAPKNAVAAGLGVSANGYTLFDDTTDDAYVSGIALGVFGVTNDEQQVVNQSIHGAHAGWNLVKQGTGGREGRVQVETLVAMGSMTGDADSTTIKNTIITITRQPGNNSAASGANATFNVAATGTPNATLSYQWYSNAVAISGATANVYTANNVATQNNYYVIVSASGADSVQSTNGVLTIV